MAWRRIGNIRGPAGIDGASTIGPPGPPGAKGEKGDKGEQGIETIGRQGPAGPEGPQGIKGEPGRDGKDGIGQDGKDGIDGPPGPRGEQGAPGRIAEARVWSPDLVFYAGEVVTHGGSSYQARRDTAKEPPHFDWIGLALAGRDGHDGADGRSPRVRGTYRADESYEALDIVALNGGSFIARREAPGECPGDGWQSLTLPGKRGERGQEGARGPKGEPGRAAEIVGWDIDGDNFAVSAVMSDQTRSTPLVLRDLFEKYMIERLSVEQG
jgi:hypothetical protein